MKKALLILCVLLFLCVPMTVFAASEKGALDDLYNAKEKDSKFALTGDNSDTEDMGQFFVGSDIMTKTALSEVGPQKYSVTLTDRYYNPYIYAYYYTKIISYTAPGTGFYTFYSITEEDTDIALFDSSNNLLDYDANDEAFAAGFFMQKDKKYYIEIRNYGSSKTVNYLMTTPSVMGQPAVNAKNNGYSKSWMQAFDFTVPKSDLISIQITPPSTGCQYFYVLLRGTNYSNFQIEEVSDLYSGASDLTVISPYENASYHLILYFDAPASTSAFKVAVDVPQFNGITSGMVNGVTYSRSLVANDTYTTHNFIAYTSGNYKLTCNRTDAKLTITDSSGKTILKNANPNTTVNLSPETDGTNYYYYYTTNGTAGTITYSTTLLSPVSSLAGITTSAGALSPVFSSSTYNYSLLVDSAATSSVTITPKPTAAGGTMKIDGVVQASKTYSVNANTNQTITIVYTSPDGSKTSTYYVNMRAKSKACAVISSGAPLIFDGYTLWANVDYAIDSVTVDASVSEFASWKLYSDSDCTAEIADKTLVLAGALNKAYLKVTSEDGRNNTVYPVLVYRATDAEPHILGFNTSRIEFYSGAFSNSSVVIKLLGTADLNVSLTRDGEPYSWPLGDLFTTDGLYVVNLTDGNNATAVFNFTIDKTAPVISAKDSANATVSKGALSNKTVMVSVIDNNLNTMSVKKDNVAISWPEDNIFSADGAYTITATDKSGNNASFAFTIDRTPPTISAVTGATKLTNDAHVNGNVIVTVADARLSSKAVTKNGVAISWPANNTFTDAAVYVITAKDTVNNTSVLKFTIDKTLPVITAKAGTKALTSGSFTKSDVVLTVTETNVGAKTVTRGGAAFTWPANNTFTLEGAYVARVTDRSGNAATFSFNIDKPPVLTVKTLNTGKILANKSLTNEGVLVTLTDAFLASKTIKKSGKAMTWPADGKLTADGVYIISAKDKIGNSVSITITVDRTAPVVTVKTKAKKVLANGGETNEAEVTATITDSGKYTKSVTKDGVNISFPSKFTAEGTYIITATDTAGNKTTFKFVIDRVAPVISAKTTKGAVVANNATVNQDVVITVTDRAAVSKTLTKNGVSIAWPTNNTVTSEGKYVVTAKDSLGYTAVPYTFTINKTGPIITARDSNNAVIPNNGITNKSVSIIVTGQTGAITVTKNGSAFAFPTGGVFTVEGTYAVSASNTLGNKTTFNFTIDKTGPVILGLDGNDDEVADGAVVRSSVTVTAVDAVSLSAMQGGNSISWPADDTFKDDAVYVITAEDTLGNVSTYTFTIDKTLPELIAVLALDETTPVSEGETVTDAAGVILSINELHLDTIIVTKDGIEYFKYPLANGDEESLLWDGAGPVTLTQNGVYFVTITDKSGNTVTLTFAISAI